MADDILWINLKILSKLPTQAKLNTSNDLFYIEKSSFYNPTSIWRMIRGDSRYMTIKKIDQVIEKASLVLKQKVNIKFIKTFKRLTIWVRKYKKNVF